MKRRFALPIALTMLAAVLLPGPAAAEPDDGPLSAGGPILNGRTYAGAIETENDTDWWVFYTAGTAQLDIQILGLGPDDCFGPRMRLNDVNGEFVASTESKADRFETEHILYTVDAGTHYVEVTPYTVAPCIGTEAKYVVSINTSSTLLTTAPYFPPPPAPPSAPASAPAPPPSDPSPAAARAAKDCERARIRVSSLTKKLRRAEGPNYRAVVRAELRNARAAVQRKC